MKRYLISLMVVAALLSGCENQGFDGEPEDPYAENPNDIHRIIPDSVWFDQFTLNKGISSIADLNADGDTVRYCTFDSLGRLSLYMDYLEGLKYTYDAKGRPTTIVKVADEVMTYFNLEYRNDADLYVPVNNDFGFRWCNSASLLADDPGHFSILPGLSRVIRYSSENKAIWSRKYIYVDSGTKQWMKIYTDKFSAGGGIEVDQIEYVGKRPVMSDSLALDTIIYQPNGLFGQVKRHYIDSDGDLMYETCNYQIVNGFIFPESILLEKEGYLMEVTYGANGDVSAITLGTENPATANAVYEYDTRGRWTTMSISNINLWRTIEYYE